MSVPKYDSLFNPLLQAIHNLGGSASISEIEDEVIKILNLSDEDINEIHKGSTTKLSYRLSWARNYLKTYGVLENSSRGVWSLTTKGKNVKSVERNEIKKYVRDEYRKNKVLKPKGNDDSYLEEEPDDEVNWKEELLNTIKEISPDAFERLCKRLLRESGFIQVEVTGGSGDGGIDGKGVVKIGGLLSFHVVFQAKRYKDTVTASVIRDFRGAMIGRADKGIIITTGTFTKDAKKEAQRDGAQPIDLIDGDILAGKLKELRIGVEVKEVVVEEITINKDWFINI